jgi:AcrR family transcriptional regulator
MQEKIKGEFLELVHQKPPELITIPEIAEKSGISESEFYTFFSSKTELIASVFHDLLSSVQEDLKHSEAYNSYSASEKILALAFLLFEKSIERRYLISESWAISGLQDSFRKKISLFLKDSVLEGLQTGEFIKRPFIENYYDDSLAWIFIRLMDFWVKDTSSEFSETEKAIDISLRLPLNLMRRNILDDGLDFGKLLLKTLKK